MKKKISLLILPAFIFCNTLLFSQTNSNVDANLVQTKLLQISLEKNLSNEDLSNFAVTDNYVNKITGAQHIYLRQTYQGIEILGTESAVHIDKKGDLITGSNRFMNSLSKRFSGESSPSLNAVQAVQSAATHLGYSVSEPLAVLSQERQADQKTKVNKGGISLSEIPVRLMYQLLEDDSFILVWDLSIEAVSKSEWYNVRVNAANGEIVNKINWTSQCDFSHTHNHDDENITHTIVDSCDGDISTDNQFMTSASSLLTGSYNVFAMPLESPYFGGRTLVTGEVDTNASPFGWHDTNGVIGAEYTVTRGNNVNAYEDGDNPGFQPNGGPSLVFNFPFDPVYNPGGNQSESAAITNLFYWNNIIHDVFYNYGFDEPSGNFQANNYGNGGLGGDWVRAEAQDGSGTCNANFSTPVDGQLPRMQMYTCGSQDGDFDNLVIAHEYGHGISIRMTGGPANSSCLNNTEQMGEGWSDWFGLMLTMTSSDVGPASRAVGTYLFGQGPGAAGIRTYQYSTNMAVNPHTYNSIMTEAVPHGVGSVWCAMLWEMTWGLIDEYGFDADIYNGSGGNNIAISLVIEGLRLQPCSPGFVDGRDAILQADLNLFGGANQCIIWEAFAKRGLGFSADQGSSNSRSDGTQAFDLPFETAIFTAPNDICESVGVLTGLGGGTPGGGEYSGPGVTDDGNGSTYTFDPIAAGIGIHTITYTIPTTSCGSASSDSDDIEVTMGIDISCPANITVNNDPGSCGAIVNFSIPIGTSGCTLATVENFDGVTAPALPAGWSNVQDVGTAINWVTSTAQSSSAPNAAFANNPNSVSLSSLISPDYTLDSPAPQLTFNTYRATESGYDGAVLEYSTDAGGTWQDILSGGGTFVSGGYNGVLSTSFSNPLGGRNAWTGNSGGFIYTVIDLNPALDGETVRFRWRMGSDNSQASTGIWIDNVDVIGVLIPPPVTTQIAGLAPGSVFPVGTTTNTFETEDELGFITTCSFDVTVLDIENPTIDTIADQVVEASINCEGVVINYTSLAVVSDNCTGLTITQDPAPGTTFDPSVTITITVTDTSGNSANTSFEVTVEDNTAPTVITQNIQANLDVNGQVIITPDDIDNGSFDNCGIASRTVTPDTFTCDDIGTHTVTLTIVDINGNSASATAIATVIDSMPPDVIVQDITVPLNENGIAIIIPSDVNDGSTDNCGIAAMSIFPTTFSCENIGENIVTLTIFDTSGNVATAQATVTIEDTMAPEIECPDDLTVEVAPGGTYTLPDYWAEGLATAEDNCTDPVTDFTQDPAPGSELAAGVHPIELTAADDYGNIATCNFVITVTEVMSIGDNPFNSESVILYPNPTDDLINIINNSNHIIESAVVTDVNGRIIEEIRFDANYVISFKNYASGVYFIRLISESNSLIKRVVKK